MSDEREDGHREAFAKVRAIAAEQLSKSGAQMVAFVVGIADGSIVIEHVQKGVFADSEEKRARRARGAATSRPRRKLATTDALVAQSDKELARLGPRPDKDEEPRPLTHRKEARL